MRLGESVKDVFDVDHLEIERLLREWRWLCPSPVALVARSAFGDLFLRNDAGIVFWLDVAVGKLTEVAQSETEFRQMSRKIENRNKLFAESDYLTAVARGLNPTSSQCIGFSVPIVFAESNSSDTVYIADLYEYVSFLGDLNRQISNLPDGAKVRLQIQPPKNVQSQ